MFIIQNSDGTRVLNREEMAQLEKYNLGPVVKKAVIAFWKTKPEREKKSIKSQIFSWTMRFLRFILPIILWINYLTPQNRYLVQIMGEHYQYYTAGILYICIFFLWLTTILLPFAAITMFMAANKIRNKDDIFNRGFLRIWKGSGKIKEEYYALFFIALISGLIVNGYYVLPIVYLIGHFLWELAQIGIKKLVEKRMDYYNL